MEIKNALDQIFEIHTHLAKSEVFSGYRAAQTLIIGIAALICALVQSYIIIPSDAIGFVIGWMGLAISIVVWISMGLTYNYFARDNTSKKYQAIIVVRQFLPSLMAGFIITVIMLHIGNEGLVFLPGLWSVLFGLGIFSMLPYLPRLVGGIGTFYLAAGFMLIYIARLGLSLSPWGMGLTFGIGNLLTALVLYLNLERKL